MGRVRVRISEAGRRAMTLVLACALVWSGIPTVALAEMTEEASAPTVTEIASSEVSVSQEVQGATPTEEATPSQNEKPTRGEPKADEPANNDASINVGRTDEGPVAVEPEAIDLLSSTQEAPASDFTYVVNYDSSGQTVTITGYVGEGGDVVIPREIEEFPVATIGSSAFEGCESLTGIALPEALASVGSSAFEGCSSLAAFELAEGVSILGG